MAPFAIVTTTDQWVRSAHDRTAIDPRTGGVELDWTEPEPEPAGASSPLGGLAFDSACRLYRSLEEGRVERRRWSPGEPAGPAEDLLAGPPPGAVGDFAPQEEAPALVRPRALGIDADDRLLIAEAGARCVLVLDLWSGRVLRRLALAAEPMDLAVGERWTWVLLGDGHTVVRMHPRGAAFARALPALPLDVADNALPLRLASGPRGALALLIADPADPGATRVVVAHDQGWRLHAGEALEAARGSDVEFDGDGAIVVARSPGESFLRFVRTDEGWLRGPSLSARGYDGSGLARTPDGRIGYWSERGFRVATASRRRFVASGSVTTYRLDSGTLHNDWGRVFVDACVPDGTRLLARFATTDDDDGRDPIARRAPANAASVRILRPDLSPPMPPSVLAPGQHADPRPLHRRETGSELPWAGAASSDRFETYEAPVSAPPGRYLWVTLDLHGATRTSPRVRALRAELHGHDHVRRLPRTFSRDPDVADFLRRFLALPDSVLDDLEGRSEQRAALLHAAGTPAEALPWLAGFVGLVLDERWPEPVRRAIVGEAAALFRVRGTVAGLQRFLRLALGDHRDVLVIERWRMRGLGGTLDGGAAGTSTSVVGSGLRVGGAVGLPGESPLSGTIDDAFATHAHRFSVVIPAVLSASELDMVRDVLAIHRPAHTLFDVCTVDSGMRIGVGLHIGLLSMIGRTGGFATATLGTAAAGSSALPGCPGDGVGAGRAGEGLRVGS